MPAEDRAYWSAALRAFPWVLGVVLVELLIALVLDVGPVVFALACGATIAVLMLWMTRKGYRAMKAGYQRRRATTQRG
jgi:hypothetical protein